MNWAVLMVGRPGLRAIWIELIWIIFTGCLLDLAWQDLELSFIFLDPFIITWEQEVHQIRGCLVLFYDNKTGFSSCELSSEYGQGRQVNHVYQNFIECFQRQELATVSATLISVESSKRLTHYWWLQVWPSNHYNQAPPRNIAYTRFFRGRKVRTPHRRCKGISKVNSYIYGQHAWYTPQSGLLHWLLAGFSSMVVGLATFVYKTGTGSSSNLTSVKWFLALRGVFFVTTKQGEVNTGNLALMKVIYSSHRKISF